MKSHNFSFSQFIQTFSVNLALITLLLFTSCAGQDHSVSALPRWNTANLFTQPLSATDTDTDRDFQLPEESTLDKVNDKAGFVILGIAGAALAVAAVAVPIWLTHR